MLGQGRKESQSAGSLAQRRKSLGGTSVRPSREAGSYLGKTAVSKPRAKPPAFWQAAAEASDYHKVSVECDALRGFSAEIAAQPMISADY
jgi:hypothetical protein